MKKITFLFFVFLLQTAFAQKGFMLNTDNEITFLLENAEGKYVENYILQIDNNPNKKGIDRFDYAEFLYDGKTLAVLKDGKIKIYTIEESLKGDNVMQGYGLVRRYGEFAFHENYLNSQNEMDVFDLITNVR